MEKDTAIAVDSDQDNQSENQGKSLNVSDLLLSVGFSIMLAWHYLVLFSPIIDSAQSLNVEGYAFSRQLVLYLSLTVTFGIIGIVSNRRIRQGSRIRPTLAVICAAGLLATVSSALCAVIPTEQTPLAIAGIAFMGASEAFLMFLWLNCFITKHEGSLLHPFSLNMIAGGAVCIVICMLQWPQSTIVSVVLPAVSVAILANDARLTHPELAGTAEPDADGREPEAGANAAADGEPAHDEAVTRARRPRYTGTFNRPRYMLLSVGIYAFSFGLMQGAFLQSGIALLITDNALVMLGIVIAGALIFVVPENLGHGVSVDLMHRFSLFAFVIGAVGVAWFHLGEPFLTASQIAVLAGFNLFDFGVMVYGMDRHSDQEAQEVRVLEGGRPLVYLCLTAGLMLGHVLIDVIPATGSEFALVMICGVSIFLLVGTTILPFYAIDSLSTPDVDDKGEGASASLKNEPANMVELLANASAEAAAAALARKEAVQEDWISPWRNSCNQIAKLYQLSPRETEIFLLIAKGRNAEHVQQKLVISTHTAKTHIANIYRKLEVHSQQELLDLIEAFRDADRRLAESDDE